MNLLINGDTATVNCHTLGALLSDLGYPQCKVATAVDGEFVPRTERDSLQLQDGMTIDIVAPIQGG